MGRGVAADTLIYTKLNRPRVSLPLVDRPRLFNLLDAGRALVTIVAPAGYGKSTLVSDWVQRSGLRYGWLSLDEGDNDPGVFLQYLLAAATALDPLRLQDFAAGPHVGTDISSPDLIHKLADTLDAIEHDCVLVLDDYHAVHAPVIHQFVAELLRYPPANLRIVLASRIDPPFALAAMRAHNELLEIRASDLRFTGDEIASYLALEVDRPLESKTVEDLVYTTEGWPAGLHLAAILLRSGGAGQAALVRGHNRYAIDYLAYEVLAQRTPAEKAFLLKTSVLHRLCPELCDAILQGADNSMLPAGQLLEQFRHENLFVIPLDDVGEWYRYHYLFRQFLQHFLRATAAPAEVAALYAAASHWCGEHNLTGEAVGYALQAGDTRRAVTLIEENRHKAMSQEQWQQVEQWLHLLPRSMIDANAQLLVAEAWLQHKYEALPLVAERLDLVEAVLSTSELPVDVEHELRGEIEALRSQQWYAAGDYAGSVAAARRALAQLPVAKAGARSVAWLYLAGGLFAMEGLQPALGALASAEDHTQYASVARRILSARCYLYWMSADMFHLQETAEELLALAQQNQWAESLAWAHYFLGNALYARNDLVGAGKHYASVVGMRHSVASAVVIHSTFGMACVLHAQGDPEAASAAAGLAYDYVRRPGKEPLQQQVIAFQAYLAARQGQLEEALRWVAGANRATLETPMPHFFAAGVAMADILVRVGAPACLSEAAQLLERLERYLAATHNTRLLAEVLLLRASLDCARQQMDSAHARLAAAVKIAEPRKLLRMFLDAPDILDALLCQFNGTSQHAAFVLQVSDARALARATGRRHPGTPVQPQPGKAAIIQPRHPDLIESLTARELEVLEMLAQRLTNKEIAAALGISVGTAKQHTRAVLSKLHAGNRRDAIAQARSMGFQLEGPIGW